MHKGEQIICQTKLPKANLMMLYEDKQWLDNNHDMIQEYKVPFKRVLPSMSQINFNSADCNILFLECNTTRILDGKLGTRYHVST